MHTHTHTRSLTHRIGIVFVIFFCVCSRAHQLNRTSAKRKLKSIESKVLLLPPPLLLLLLYLLLLLLVYKHFVFRFLVCYFNDSIHCCCFCCCFSVCHTLSVCAMHLMEMEYIQIEFTLPHENQCS